MTATPDSFVPRAYPEIVRDLLTTLTGGTVRETVVVPDGDVLVLDRLADRPLRRVSHLRGEIEVERRAEDGEDEVDVETVTIPYSFTDADFEVVATGAAGDEPDAVRFRKRGRRPPVGSTVTVNYYPSETRPVPITDLNVGSVARTLLESVGRELAVEELLLEHVYRSAFLETAEGANLDRVVALVGVRRRPAGIPTTRVRFTRAPGSIGRITVPTATAVADADGNRYATVAPLVLEPGEPSRAVLAAGVARSTPAVPAGTLDRLEVLVAGVAGVGNDDPAAPAAAAETDDDLRRRARGALAVAARGTVDALRFGLLAIPGVKDVAVTEFPHGVSGEIRVDVAYESEGDAALESAVAERIEELRPAGIRVLAVPATPVPLTVSVALTLAGSGVPAADLVALQESLEERVVEHVRGLPPGGSVRQARVAQAALADERVVDAALELSTGGPPAATLAAPEGAVLQPVRPFSFTVTTETGAGAPGAAIVLDALVPVHLVPGVTATEAVQAMTAAATSYAAGLGGGGSVTVDGLLAALRDDSRYAVVREDVAVTAEREDRFLQLADGVGAQPVSPEDRVTVRRLDLDVREGGV